MVHELPDDLSDRMKAILRDAYKAGFRDGCARTRDAILRAAALPEDGAQYSTVQADAPQHQVTGRAPRGSARTAIVAILQDNPGLTLSEMVARLPSVDRAVSPRTLGGELHRNKGRLYDQRNSRWYLSNADAARKGGGMAAGETAAPETRSHGEYNAAA